MMKTNTRYRFLIIFFSLCVQTMQAQKCLVRFEVYEEVTQEALRDAQVALFLEDSIPVAFRHVTLGGESVSHNYNLEFDFRVGKYSVVINRRAYQPYKKQFEIKTRRSTVVDLGALFLKKNRDIVLSEAVVKATRIKMVTRGDTIVYDAAAFELAEGSMLDALIAQLPGTTLKDGQIKVNGKPIESLIVNGEDFFSGNPKVALQNLPAYTVKMIKVYDREAKDAYLTKRPAGLKKFPGEDEHIVMDVILKKAYSVGWMGNVEGSYGLPSDRYMGRAFLLGYTDRLRLAVYTNNNNIKNTQSGSAVGEFSGGWSQAGALDVKIGGVDYQYKKGDIKLNGSVMLTHELPEVIRKQSSEVSYGNNVVFNRALSEERIKRFHFLTAHHFEYAGKRQYVSLSPSIDYKKDNFTTIYHSAAFDVMPQEDYRLQSLDTLFSPMGLQSSFVSRLLNRYANEKNGKSGWTIARLQGELTQSIPHFNDVVRLHFNGDYRSDTNRPLIATHRAFGAASTQVGQGEAIQQRQDWVSQNYNIEVGVRYTSMFLPYQVKRGHYGKVEPNLLYQRNYNGHDNNYWLFKQQLLGVYLGQITPPSSINPQILIRDLNNSVNSRYACDTYTGGVNLAYMFMPDMEKPRQYSLGLSVHQHLRRESLSYDRSGDDTTIIRWNGSFQPILDLKYQNQTEVRNTEVTFSYSYSTTMPSIYYQLGTINDSDPMNIMVNRPGLHRARTNSVQGRLYYSWLKTHSQLTLSANYRHTDRAIAQARFYNRNTGVSTWIPQNVNGNWNTSASAQYTMPFGKNEAFQLKSYSGFGYVHSVDYASERAILERSVVRNLTLSQQLGLTYRVNKHSFGIDGSVAWLRSRSALGLFDKVSALDYKARANALLYLPLGLELSTDMNLYARRGYADRTLNTTHWVWNASLAKTLLKGNLTLKLMGVDMLGQISNVQHSINAQGRTETWVNTLPSYAMLSLTYRFHAVPKKKQN